MGLDVYLYKCADRIKSQELRRAREVAFDEIYSRVVGEQADDTKLALYHQECQEWDKNNGFDSEGDLSDPVLKEERIEETSKIHPDHNIYRVGYWRSSYNPAGINSFLKRTLGEAKDLHYIAESAVVNNEDDYIRIPDWDRSLARVREVKAQLQLVVNNGIFDTSSEGEDAFFHLMSMNSPANEAASPQFKEMSTTEDEARKLLRKMVTPTPIEEALKWPLKEGQTFEEMYDAYLKREEPRFAHLKHYDLDRVKCQLFRQPPFSLPNTGVMSEGAAVAYVKDCLAQPDNVVEVTENVLFRKQPYQIIAVINGYEIVDAVEELRKIDASEEAFQKVKELIPSGKYYNPVHFVFYADDFPTVDDPDNKLHLSFSTWHGAGYFDGQMLSEGVIGGRIKSYSIQVGTPGVYIVFRMQGAL
jgi:hypothetical protein